MIGIINAVMYGAHSEPGEPDWSEPDIYTADDWHALIGDVAEFAANNPHMIVFEVAS